LVAALLAFGDEVTKILLHLLRARIGTSRRMNDAGTMSGFWG